MPPLTQVGRPISVVTALGPDALALRAVQGTEAVSEPFRFDLDLLADAATMVPFDKLLGKPATVTITLPSGGQRLINGILWEIARGPAVAVNAEKQPLIRYRAVLVPKLWALSRTVRSRVFQQLTVAAILKHVLTGIPARYQLNARYTPRDYCVQYQESDLAFASRLMEEEGIWYSFEHTADTHTLMVTDRTTGLPALDGPPARYELAHGGHRAEDRVTGWEIVQRLTAGKVSLNDFCFELPDVTMAAETPLPGSLAAGTATLSLTSGVNADWELAEYPGRVAARFDGVDPSGTPAADRLEPLISDVERTARVRMEQEACEAVRITGESTCRHFSPGKQFTLDGHGEGDGDYLLTRVHHAADLGEAYTTGATPAPGAGYVNRFEAIPANLPHRPRRTMPRPRIESVQTAIVTGPEGEEIFTDKYGRVKVRFPWDRHGKTGGDSSCWVRVAQAWAGSGWGAVTIPRIGQEVVVAFEDGDPDRPLIVGSVYNARNEPPYPLPQYKTHSGLKSHSQFNPDAEAFSGLTFEDFNGQEHVHLHSQRHMSHTAEKHFVSNVGGQQHTVVGGGSTRQVGGFPGINNALAVGPNDLIAGQARHTGSGPPAATSIVPEPIVGGVEKTEGGAYYVSPADVFSGPASEMNFVMGWSTANTLGMYSQSTFGTLLMNTVNPFAIDDFFENGYLVSGVLTGGLGFLVGPALRNMLGMVTTTVGANTQISYGRSMTVQRGPELKGRYSSGNPNFKLTTVFGTLYNLGCVAEAVLPAIDSNSKEFQVAGMLTDAAFTLISANLWAMAERGALAATLFGKYGTSVAVSGKWVDKSEFPLLIAGDEVAKLSKEAAVVAAGEADKKSAETGNRTDASDVSHTITAPQLVLVSSPTERNEDQPNGILVMANGFDGQGGTVQVAGSESVVLLGGIMGSVRCESLEGVGKVTVDCGSDGMIVLQSGATWKPNYLMMEPAGITVSASGFVANRVGTNQIFVNEAIISLRAGTSLLMVTEDGISLECGPNSLRVTAEGVVVNGMTIQLAADTTLGVKCADFNIL